MSTATTTSPTGHGTTHAAGGILHPGGWSPRAGAPPDCLHDLALDQLIDELGSGRDEYRLGELFSAPTAEPEVVHFRHAVFRDLDRGDVRHALADFGAAMREVRRGLEQADGFYYDVQKWFVRLSAMERYVTTIGSLVDGLDGARPESEGLRQAASRFARYRSGAGFAELAGEVARVREGLDRVRYRVHVSGNTLTVSLPLEEPDYASDVTEAFRRFRQGEVESQLSTLRDYVQMNHVEAAVADRVARLFPAEFGRLAALCSPPPSFVDPAVSAFERESQFYLSWLDLRDRLTAAGLAFSLPAIVDAGSDLRLDATFDVVLASRLVADGREVVCNDLELAPDERLLVVTGPNQGGKTTFARTIGQVTYLAGLGLPVPGRHVTLPLPDAVLTHFETGENLRDRIGALEDDLRRLRQILDHATSDSVVILNEVFTSTSAQDALELSTRILGLLEQRGCRSVFVTFLDELARLTDRTVSMVAQVDPEDPTRRTFEVRRAYADGAAYAEAIAERHGLTRAALRRRLAP
jgi:hypothetical protein